MMVHRRDELVALLDREATDVRLEFRDLELLRGPAVRVRTPHPHALPEGIEDAVRVDLGLRERGTFVHGAEASPRWARTHSAFVQTAKYIAGAVSTIRCQPHG